MKKQLISLLLISGLICCFSSNGYAQQKNQKTMSQVQAEKANKIKEKKEFKYNHPLLNGLVVGFNMAEPALKIFGRDYCSWEGIAELNIHNRFFPEVTLGVGSGKKNAEDTELSVHCKPAFFTKVGMNYNFNFNGDNPNYFYVGIKYGFTSYKTNYSGMTYDDGYWETTGPYNYSNQKFNSHWLEFAFGIRVKIIENFYMGWGVQYKPLLKQKDTENAAPWYIPGYGVNGSGFGINYNVYYQLPFFKTKKKDIVAQP